MAKRVVARGKAGLTKVAEAIGSTIGKIVAKTDSAKNALSGEIREIKKRAPRVNVRKAKRKAHRVAKRVRKSVKAAF